MNKKYKIISKKKYEATTSLGVVSKKYITKNSIKALIYPYISMIIYASIRFKYSYTISPIIALVHDIVMVLIVLVY